MGQQIQKLLASVGNPKSAPLPTPQPQPGVISKSTGAASNFFNNLSTHIASFGESVLSPVTKGIASGVRAIQATPNVIGAVGDAITGNQQSEQGNINAANQKMAQPLNMGLQNGPQATMQGSTNAQNLGTAAQAASFLVPETSLGAISGGAVAGGLQAGGSAAENPNATAGGVAENTLGGAALGAGIGAAAKYAPEALQKVLPKQGETPTSNTNPYDIPTAQVARETASTNAVQGMNTMNQTVQSDLSQMGQEFKQRAQQIETNDPEKGMDIIKPVADELKSIKENAKFALPDFVANKDWTVATPTQAQDLITQLNRATFQAKASGEFAVNQQLIDLTNQIKNSASKSFGPEWDQTYSNYANGRSVLDKLDGIVNLDPKASPTDLMKQFNTIAKLHESPEGSKLLDQAVEAYKNERGIDLTDPVQAVNQVLKSQGQLEIANKGSYMTQFKEALKNPNMAARRVAYLAGSVLGLATLGTAFRKQIGSFISGH